jgi:serine/threonine protein kinase
MLSLLVPVCFIVVALAQQPASPNPFCDDASRGASSIYFEMTQAVAQGNQVEAIALNGTDTVIVAVGNEIFFYEQGGHHSLLRRLVSTHRPVALQLVDSNRLVAVSAERVSLLTFNVSLDHEDKLSCVEVDLVTAPALNGSRMTGGLFCTLQNCYMPAINMSSGKDGSKTGSMHGILQLDLKSGHVSRVVAGPGFYYPIGIGMLNEDILVVSNHWGNNLVAVWLPTLEVQGITASDHFNGPSQLAVDACNNIFVTNTDGNNIVRVFNPLTAPTDEGQAPTISDNILVEGYASGVNFSSPFGIAIGTSSVDGSGKDPSGDDDNGNDDDDDDDDDGGDGSGADGGGGSGSSDTGVVTLFVTNLALPIVTEVVPLHQPPWQDLFTSSLVIVAIVGGLVVGGALVGATMAFARRCYKRDTTHPLSPHAMLARLRRGEPSLARARAGFGGKHHQSPLLVPLIPRVLMGKVEVLGSEQTPEFLKYEGHRVSWLIDATELRLDEMIGAGAHAQVFRGQWHGSPVAVKHIVTSMGLQRMREKQARMASRLSVASAQASSSDGGDYAADPVGGSASSAEHRQMEEHKETVLDTCFKEVAMLSEIRHPHIVQFFGLAMTRNTVLLVTELCHTSLHEIVYHTGLKSSSTKQGTKKDAGGDAAPRPITALTVCTLHVRCWLEQLVSALIFLHDRGIVHRDIKLANVLLSISNNSSSSSSSSEDKSEKDKVLIRMVNGSPRSLYGNNGNGTEARAEVYMPPPLDLNKAAPAAPGRASGQDPSGQDPSGQDPSPSRSWSSLEREQAQQQTKIKLCDFGLARFVASTVDSLTATSACGTPLYMAPEIISYTWSESSKYSAKVDVWSFGVLAWALWTRRQPYQVQIIISIAGAPP